MVSNILFLPDLKVFNTVNNAAKNGEKSIALDLFKACLIHSIDTQERLIYISPEMRNILIDKNLIPKTIKRLSLYQMISVHTENVSGDYQTSLIRLASILSIDTNSKIYIICDDVDTRNKMNETAKFFTCISSETALELVKNMPKNKPS